MIHLVGMSLVEIYKEYEIITKTGKTVQSGHFDDKGKQIIYTRVSVCTVRGRKGGIIASTYQ